MKTPSTERGNFLVDLFWNLVIVGLTVAACYVAYVRGWLDPYLKRPLPTAAIVASATPAPAPVEVPVAVQTPTPAPASTPIAEPTATPEPAIDLRTVNRQFWPQQVKLLKAEEFAVIFNGRAVGSASVPAGTLLKLVSIQGNALEVSNNGATKLIQASETDVLERVRALVHQGAGQDSAIAPATAVPAATPTPAPTPWVPMYKSTHK